MDHTALITDFTACIQRFTVALVKCPKAMWDFKPAPGKWSIHENIIHVADAEAHFYVRLRSALAEPGHTISAFDQDLWATNLHYDAQDADDALDLIRLMRKFTIPLLHSLPPEAWQRTLLHPERGEQTFEQVLTHSIAHTDMHTAQVARTFTAWQAQQAQ